MGEGDVDVLLAAFTLLQPIRWELLKSFLLLGVMPSGYLMQPVLFGQTTCHQSMNGFPILIEQLSSFIRDVDLGFYFCQ